MYYKKLNFSLDSSFLYAPIIWFAFVSLYYFYLFFISAAHSIWQPLSATLAPLGGST
jgi:hypothetical protein